MTGFENKLLEKGYVKYVFNNKKNSYELAKRHVISTMVNLAHFYIHKSNNTSLGSNTKNVICFGLHEVGKPPTLIYPRPSISVKRNRHINNEECIVIENEMFDDSMNLVLSKENTEQIFKALFDNSILFEYDLT